MDELEKLKAENEQLKKICENRSDIISITAHQLRTSLSALKWILKMLKDEDVGKLTYEQRELINKAFSSNERMLAVINDLLTLSHTEDVSIAYNFQKTDILKLVEQILFEFYEEANKKEVDLIFLKQETVIPQITCDKEMIHVVIQNLVENSIKYSNPRGKVFISLKQKDKDVELSVHDSGIGINPEDTNNIFKKFFRAQNAIKKDTIGSGLGLFTTKTIVEKHHGKIWFENIPSGGTTFFVSLPIE